MIKYEIALNVRALREGEIYTAGANIYGEGRQIEKVASLYIPAESKRKAVMTAIELLLNEVSGESRVSIRGRQVGRAIRKRLKRSILQIVEEKRLILSMRYNELTKELAELNELAQDAADRRSNTIALI